MNCTECGGVLSTLSEYDMEVYEYCAIKLGIFEPECTICGAILSSDECKLGIEMCFNCIEDEEGDE